MKIYKNANDTVRVGAYEEDGVFHIVIEKERKMLVATRGSHKSHVEYDYTHFEKTFKTREQANAYFKGIKRKNPTLTRIK